MVVTLVLLMSARRTGQQTHWDESGAVWSVPGAFTTGGSFDLLDWSSPQYGYAVPLLSKLLVGLGDLVGAGGWIVQNVTYAALLAAIGAFFVPSLVAALADREPRLTDRIVVSALMVLFWRGYVVYPTLAVPATAAALGAAMLVLHASRRRPSRLPVAVWWLGAGLLVGIAANAQERYWLLAVAIAVVAIRTPASTRAMIIAACVTGVAVIQVPQILASANYHHALTPGSWRTTSGQDVTQARMAESLDYQRVVLGIATPGAPVSPLRVRDTAGEPIARSLANCCINPASGTYDAGSYAAQLVQHPIAAFQLLARRTFNAADVWHDSPYATAVLPVRAWPRIINYAFGALAMTQLALIGVGLARRRVTAPVAPAVLITGLIATVVPLLTLAARSSDFLLAHVLIYSLAAGALVTIPRTLRRGWAVHRVGTAASASAVIGLSVVFVVVALRHSDRVLEHLG